MPLYLNADVWTFDPETPRATALLTHDEKIVAVGQEAELTAHATGPDAAERIDLGGRTVIPGFVDAHLHALSYAESLAEVDLVATRSLAEAVEAIAAFAAELPAGRWITGGRWDFNRWSDTADQPDRTLLDAAVPNHPVAVWSIDMHTLWCNGAALAAAGIDARTADPDGGQIVRGASGTATGILREDATDLVLAAIPAAGRDLSADRMAAAQELWLSEGLTGLHDIDGAASRQAWYDLAESGRQKMRVVKYLRPEELDWAASAGPDGWRTGDGDSWFLRGGLKLFSDGALGSQSSFMSSPFPHAHGEEPNYGIQLAALPTLIEQIEAAYARGIAVAVHAIGDAANHVVLDAIEATNPARSAAEARFGRVLQARIEHAQFLQPADVARFAALDVVASMQPRHCISDLHLLERLRPDAGLAAYAWTDLASAGARLAFGSDGPVEPANPFAAIYAAMTRADIGGDPATVFQPERRMDAYQAIAAHTSGPAQAVGRQDVTGVLKAGYDADFVAVETSPFAAAGLTTEWVAGGGSGAGIGAAGAGVGGAGTLRYEYASESARMAHAEAIRDTRVATTVVGGRVRYQG
ncbi:amidohydrolase [Brevibacterium sp. 91QC2O2]|uniref:amidohydrolase n=1 Tax=Brevibacterium sp. 91QC2O2 TaxID=2968458 RepID=UPI00211BCBCC|nr:amidohydrolase [Brevibacterium sp. 91QC2O2]MCQ9369351.1 amidohydrolase [Brevibacterium sp. 91QC2O2]